MLGGCWRVVGPDPGRAAALAAACDIGPLLAQLLLNRGIDTPVEARRFLFPTLDKLTDPLALAGMAQAVERLQRAQAAQEPILIFGDSDVDGVTASAVLYELVTALGVRAVVRLSNRLQDGYGFPQPLLKRVLRNEVRVVILADCGTNQPEEIRAMAQQGIDVVILDHHLPAAAQAQPAVLVNPRCALGPGQELSSAGLAFMLAKALEPLSGRSAQASLDLAALGTLADCAPLIGDNRILVCEGLLSIFHSLRPGLQQLIADVELTKPTPEQLLRRLIPRLNASGRLGEPAPAWQLLIERSSSAVAQLALTVGQAHATTKRLHRQITAQAHGQADSVHLRDELVMVLGGTGWHPGVMGPVAAQLAERYERPAIAVALDGDVGVGSGRSVVGFNLFEALRACDGFLLRYGGHAQACGLTIEAGELGRFRQAINEHARGQSQRDSAARLADLAMSVGELSSELAAGIDRLRPFGHGNPPPRLLIRQAVLERDAEESWLADASGRIRIRGRVNGLLPGERCDVLIRLSLIDGEAVASIGDVRLALEQEAVGP
ncbi:MAG: DHH family phosphoesterase [Candidatus Omnitrophica bacterium]|nr:DHH family phosphoesterase [Candidatus Omnitrophota bacterium]